MVHALPAAVIGLARRGAALVVAAAALVIVASWLARAQAAPVDTLGVAQPDDVQRGRGLYLTGCSSCHGLDGRGTALGPTLQGVGAASAYFQLTTGRMPLANSAAQAVRKRQAYGIEDTRRLVAYVGSLGNGPPVPAVDLTAGSLAEGNQIFSQNCAACHNSQGSGGALGRSINAPSLSLATPTQVAAAVRVGPGSMPVFGPDTLSDQQVDALARYVEYLRSPEDRGGSSLGRLGPIPEGFVAWVLGLGAMLGFAYWIGTRD